ncbi:MAG TPA: YgcG family protein, partial [Gammaproteobacteria bacterium]|nr:YgcG family protein [Gammaproteobacteria bacterium]
MLLFLLTCSFISQAQIPVPTLTGHIIDQTATLTLQERGLLEHKLKQFEAQKGAQIVVLIIPSLGRTEPVEQYALRVAEKWKLGRKGLDDGVLLVIVKLDRRLRIEVGYGLEGVLTDALCNHIINTMITPQFKQNNFYKGIDDGLNKIMQTIDNIPPPDMTMQEFLKECGIYIFIVCVLAVLFIIGTFIFLRGVKNFLQNRFGLNPFFAIVLTVVITFLSILFFDIVAILIFPLLVIILKIKYGQGGHFGSGGGPGSPFSGGGGR